MPEVWAAHGRRVRRAWRQPEQQVWLQLEQRAWRQWVARLRRVSPARRRSLPLWLVRLWLVRHLVSCKEHYIYHWRDCGVKFSGGETWDPVGTTGKHVAQCHAKGLSLDSRRESLVPATLHYGHIVLQNRQARTSRARGTGSRPFSRKLPAPRCVMIVRCTMPSSSVEDPRD